MNIFNQKPWLLWLLLIVLPPIGIIVLYKLKKFNKPVRALLSVVLGFLFLFQIGIASAITNPDTLQPSAPVSTNTSNQENKDTTSIAPKTNDTTKQSPSPSSSSSKPSSSATTPSSSPNASSSTPSVSSPSVNSGSSSGSGSSYSAQAPAAVSPIPPQQETKDITVYITKTGHKYHRAGCRYLSRSEIAITLSQAKAEGYTPCSVCNPPQ